MSVLIIIALLIFSILIALEMKFRLMEYMDVSELHPLITCLLIVLALIIVGGLVCLVQLFPNFTPLL